MGASRPKNNDVYIGFNKRKMKRGTPIQNFSEMALNGTVILLDGLVFAQRELQRGTTLGFICPFAQEYSGGRQEYGDILLRNHVTGEYLFEKMHDAVHFGTYMTSVIDIEQANCCILDDSRIVMLRTIFNLKDSCELVCFMGNWESISPEL